MRKKLFKNFFIFAIIFAIMLISAACDASENAGNGNIIGRWQTVIDLAEMYDMNKEDLSAAGFDVEALNYTLTYEFSEDGTLKISAENPLVGNSSQEVKYKAENGRIYVSPDFDSEIDETSYTEYEISEERLTLVSEGSANGENVQEEILDVIYPMVFTKID